MRKIEKLTFSNVAMLVAGAAGLSMLVVAGFPIPVLAPFWLVLYIGILNHRSTHSVAFMGAVLAGWCLDMLSVEPFGVYLFISIVLTHFGFELKKQCKYLPFGSFIYLLGMSATLGLYELLICTIRGYSQIERLSREILVQAIFTVLWGLMLTSIFRTFSRRIHGKIKQRRFLSQ